MRLLTVDVEQQLLVRVRLKEQAVIFPVALLQDCMHGGHRQQW